MAGELTRDKIQELLSGIRYKRPDLVERELRKKLDEEGISGTVTRGGKTYDLVDYLMKDLESYGVSG